QFFYAQGLHHFTLVNAEGAIEAAPTLGYADIIVDLTQTGTTLRENHLKILSDGVIMNSQACLVGNQRILRENPAILENVRVLLEYIDGASSGRGYYQLTANMQGEDAETIAQKVLDNPMTRGLQGPTLAPIYGIGGSWYTVTITISAQDLLPAVEYIRSIGGTQTTITPVRYIFMEQSPTFTRLQEMLNKT
ncbi:MAG: ATP phosphoribosyltransferase, partial [Anaerolineae bacterium]|nr:ATP phosphoribosyltransferase [Anaerolineae bacterium]